MDQQEVESDPELVARFRAAIADKRALHFPTERMPKDPADAAADQQAPAEAAE